jgi:C4-dicarboxylate-specific signal transduction histidine kinase
MTASSKSRNDSPLEASIPAGAAPLESILCTNELRRRPSRPPNYEEENRALVALVSALADTPGTVLQTLADRVLGILHADSAGLSLLTEDRKRFYWAAIAGEWRPHIGGGTPRNFGPCGDVLDCNSPMLFAHWERRYPYLSAAMPLADEGLLVPFHVNGKAVGTIWAIAHSSSRRFDAEDLRLLESMGRFASAAYQAAQSIENLKSEIAARDRAEEELRELTGGLEAQVRVRTEELRRSEALLAEAQRLSATGSFCWRVATDEMTWSEQLYRIFDFDPGVPVTLELISSRVHPQDIPLLKEMIERARGAGNDLEYEHRLQLRDHSVKYLHLVAHATRDQQGRLEYIGSVQDVTQRQLSEEALGKARSELAHVARVTSLGTLTASIAHEVNQPIGASRNNAHAALRFLAADPPDLAEVREALECVVNETYRASEIIDRIRDQVQKLPPRMHAVDVNDAIEQVTALVRGELLKHRVSVQMRLADALPPVHADRVQLQQVMLNLILNGIEAIVSVDDEARELAISTESNPKGGLLVGVADSGPGVAPQDRERIFESFYTTKPDGVGMGLSICRSIIDVHGGRLWADAHQPRGAVFKFTLPVRK